MGFLRQILIVGLLLVCKDMGAQEEAVLWTENLELSWEDFKDSPNMSSRAAALTASGISYEFTAEDINGELNISYKVSAFFYPEQSWYKPEVCNQNILNHEQLHFDIAELFARKMRSKLEKAKFTSNVKKEIKEIYKTIIKELSAFQNSYDKETDFSRNLPQQLLWNKKIQLALADSLLD